MAVDMHLSEPALRRHLRPFQVGELIEARGLGAGGLNTQYAINTTRGRYILRILADRSTIDARFEEALLRHLARRGLTVPRMLDAGGRSLIVPIASRQQVSVFDTLPGRAIGVFQLER